MGLVQQWREIERGLPDGWSEAGLVLRTSDEGQAARAAALLASFGAGRSGRDVRFRCRRAGSGARADAVERLLSRLDRERIGETLELLAVRDPDETPAATLRPSLADAWAAQLDALPPDWSDVYAEVELRSTDHLERAALLMAPLNAATLGGPTMLRFRCARRFGYGAAPEMARRCLERLDGEGIRGDVRILRALSDTDPVATQGPVWYVGGRSV